ncbi:MAG: tetratricopeptide repeat protein [Candidatus Odinarchaeota archaeon]
MPHPELDQLTKAEYFFNACKIDEALELLNDHSLYEGLDLKQKRYFQFLTGLILLYQHNIEEAIKLGEQMLREGQKHNDNVYSFDGLFVIIDGMIQTYKFNDAKKKIEEAEDVLELISNKPKDALILREARLVLLRAALNIELGNYDKAEKYLEKLFEFQKELGYRCEFARANVIMARIMMWVKSRFDLAMECAKRILLIAKEIKFNHYWICIGHGMTALVYQCIGELDNSLKHYMKAMVIIKKFKSNLYIASGLNNIGNLHAELGDYEMALQYLEESLKFWERDPLNIEDVIDSIITVALKKGDTALAQKYFQRLENMYNQTPDSRIEILYKYNKALMLKNSSRIRDKAKAEKLFKLIIKTETTIPDIIINSYIHLCDLLYAEFRINKNDDVLEEINHNITRLLTIAEKSHSYIVFCETFILQAKFALLTFNIKAARRFLTQAQKIAESYGMKRLAKKISHEHDELLTQLNIWENYKKSEATLSERLRLARLNEQMEVMIKKKIVEVPKLSDEDPVLLLIVSEGGIPTFSKLFTKTLVIEEDLISSFLAAFNTFSAELFSEGLDRASFGDFTVLMKPISTFLVCYLFKGQSFSAQIRIQSFIENMKNNEELLEKFNQYYKTNQVVKLQDVPLLNSLIIETFIKKKNF